MQGHYRVARGSDMRYSSGRAGCAALVPAIAVERVVDGVASLLCGRADGLVCFLRALAEGVARVAGAGADITVAERLTGGVEIRPSGKQVGCRRRG